MTTCYELKISLSETLKPALIDLLNIIGEHDFVEGFVECDVEFEYGEEHLSRDYYSELAQDVPLVLYNEDEARLKGVVEEIKRLSTSFGLDLSAIRFELNPFADQNWRESWKESFRPIDIDGVFAILPPWEDKSQFSQPHLIEIDPGMAFGTGQHETTKMCLSLLNRIPLHHLKRVFDVGMGSGILAIAAKMLGAETVLGCDIDPESIEIAINNAQVNKVPDIRFTATPLHEIVDKDFSLVFANIQSKPLKKLFKDIAARTAPTGKIIVSGILESEYQDFREFLETLGVDVEDFVQLGHWTAFVCVKKG